MSLVLKTTSLNRLLTLLIVLAFSLCAWAAPAGFGQPMGAITPIEAHAHDVSAIITLHGPIDAITYSSVQRRLKEAQRRNCSIVVFDINSAGGLPGSALRLAKLIASSPLVTVGYIHSAALGTAILPALACRRLVFAPRGILGDGQDIASEHVTGELSLPAASKKLGLVLQTLAALCRRNGYDRAAAFAMVDASLTLDLVRNRLTQEQRLVEPVVRRQLVLATTAHGGSHAYHPWVFVKRVKAPGSLLTLSAKQARRLKFSAATAQSHDDLLALLNMVGPKIFVMRLNFLERFARWLAEPAVRFFLFLILVVCGYIEFAHPGLIFPGLAALLAMALLVGAPYLTGLANWWEILLILAGAAIIVVDIVVYGGIGHLAIPGFILIVVGIVASFIPGGPAGGIGFSAATAGSLQTGVAVVVLGTFGGVAILLLLGRFISLTPGLKRVALRPGPAAAISMASVLPETLFVGAIGRATSDLRPAGKAEFDRYPVDVITSGEFIEEGATVVVAELHENQVLVKEAR
ncbi:MAG: hypothetical protein HKL96_03175 [Phycisphaerales bacterium]|nr:hypothetical protein [Phycisphaerales bacterium]